MINSIEHILKINIDIIYYSSQVISYIRRQNFNKALNYSAKANNSIMIILEDILINQPYFNNNSTLVDINFIKSIISGLLQAQEDKDYILLADLYEMQLIPFFLKLQENIVSNEDIAFNENLYNKNINSITNIDSNLGKQLLELKSPLELLDNGYCVEYTSCGLMTLALYDYNNRKYYLHSNGQVQHEAAELAREWFDDEHTDYIIYGLGFGYHISELLELDDKITIWVYESDINVIRLACAFTNVFKLLSDGRVKIIYDPFYEKLISVSIDLKADKKFLIYYPSLRNIGDSGVREWLEDYFISYSSIKNQLHNLNSNFKYNIKQYDYSVDALREEFQGKDLYIIAAGPSLDKNYLELKNISRNGIILATGTVCKKLLNAGIKPDYIIIIDANKPVLEQVRDIREERIPLLHLSTVYSKVLENYQGKKFIICQKGFQKAEEYAIKKGYNLFQTGGSVSTTALDLGIQFGCKRIIFLGLDLAYTNNQDHASGTSNFNTVRDIDLRQVEDIYGNMIGTSKNLDIYRKWIERRIKDVKNIEIIDASEGGAKIKGMKIINLSKCI